jgi:hypothetical protein
LDLTDRASARQLMQPLETGLAHEAVITKHMLLGWGMFDNILRV